MKMTLLFWLTVFSVNAYGRECTRQEIDEYKKHYLNANRSAKIYTNLCEKITEGLEREPNQAIESLTAQTQDLSVARDGADQYLRALIDFEKTLEERGVTGGRCEGYGSSRALREIFAEMAKEGTCSAGS